MEYVNSLAIATNSQYCLRICRSFYENLQIIGDIRKTKILRFHKIYLKCSNNLQYKYTL